MIKNISKSQLVSLESLMDRSIDYAGIFPPGNLPLYQAIKNYRNFIDVQDSWMLRSFVIPVAQLEKLEEHMNLFSSSKKLKLSLILTKSDSAEEFTNICHSDTENINSFIDKYKKQVLIESIEAPLPPVEITKDILDSLLILINSFNVQIFCEMTRPLSSKYWISNMRQCITSLSEFNKANSKVKLGYKLRTGGIKSELIPTIDRVIYSLIECYEKDLPIKFTAGLHHPIRMYRQEVKDKMHGFLNVFIAFIFNAVHKLNIEEMTEILSEENSKEFKFTDSKIKWGIYSVNAKQIKKVKDYFSYSFGSCSFEDPRKGLRELKVMN